MDAETNSNSYQFAIHGTIEQWRRTMHVNTMRMLCRSTIKQAGKLLSSKQAARIHNAAATKRRRCSLWESSLDSTLEGNFCSLFSTCHFILLSNQPTHTITGRRKKNTAAATAATQCARQLPRNGNVCVLTVDVMSEQSLLCALYIYTVYTHDA